MAAKMASALKTYHGSARREWTICLIDYNGIGHVVHDNVLKCHVGGCTASWRVGPGLDPNAIWGTCHGTISDHKSAYISLIPISSQTSDAM
jgi:hypothetical protein